MHPILCIQTDRRRGVASPVRTKKQQKRSDLPCTYKQIDEEEWPALCRLPSFTEAFTASVPLTRIRDIAHRNDIPGDLKQEIKHTIQV